ncbi:unnamed protein product [Diatraea saccharalis]|uniref:Uncharacterized protein n=1 Tax=Diatraea saccharalis TaxID=40085 RepID=A0A9N9RAQ4_9NEOP|nr:unnamed protein product [Diatraea saccharalis]
MSVELRSSKKEIFLIGDIKYQITGSKLPSNGQVLAVLFYNIREVNLSINESANLTIRECIIYWEKARIPTKSLPNCVKKLVSLYQIWRDLQKNSKKTQDVFKQRRQEFLSNLNNLFDIAHVDALQLIKINEDRVFLQRQREPGRPGHLAGVDKKLTEKEEKTRLRNIEEEKRRVKYLSSLAPSTSSYEHPQRKSSSDSEITVLQENKSSSSGMSSKPDKICIRKNFMTPKLVAALDRCQLSVRDSVFIIEATIEALGHNTDEFPISKSSIHRIRTEMRRKRANAIKINFRYKVPDTVTVHWDGKLLPALDARKSKEERLPIVISYDNNEQLIAVPKLVNSSGSEQAQAVWNAIIDWNLEDRVQILCCDTTASNTGHINGACVLLEQKLGREMLVFACRHHVYELVLKSVFEVKISQVTTSPDIPLFKKFRENWKNVDAQKIEICREKLSCLNDSEINKLIEFYRSELIKEIARDDYRELIELSIIFLGGDTEKKFKIRPPGAMHQARWMARAIYSLKISLLSSQFNISNRDKAALLDVCLFIVTSYVKPWLQCILAVKAPHQDLCFLKSMKAYESIDKSISKAALQKFCQHLWYLTDEASVLSLFDDEVDQETKVKMVANLAKENPSAHIKRYIASKEELCGPLYGMSYL